NISTMVGSLYAENAKNRDDGFNIFYTGINLGAAISPLLCGFVGETYGWHYGFGLATIGMLVGLAVFVMPTLVTQLLIMAAALASAAGMLIFRPDNIYAISINVFVAICLMVAAVVAWAALSRGGLPRWAGGRPENMDSRHDWKIYLGTAIAIPIFALLVSGFSPFTDPPKDAELKTKDDLLAERVDFLEQFNVDTETIALVKEAGIDTEPKLRGEPYQLIDKEYIASVKGKLDKAKVEEFIKKTLSIDDLKDGSFASINLDTSATKELLEKLASEFSGSLPEDPEDLQKIDSIDSAIAALNESRAGIVGTIAGIFLEEVSKPAGLVLTVLGLLAFGYLLIETFRLEKIPRERMIAALILIFFQMLFFAFFEQAGSSVNNFTDRNIDRVGESSTITKEQVGETIQLEPTQAQLGYAYNSDGDAFTNSDLDELRKIEKELGLYAEKNDLEFENIKINWEVAQSNVGMGTATRLDELPASIFQSFNAIFILIFALIFNWLWFQLGKLGLDPNAPIKFGLGLIQLGLGFGAFWMGAQNHTDVGMVSIGWLTLGILLQTTGELCLSPVGLSTMTKLSPKALVSTLMGAWFLATAFSQYLAAIISQFTSVGGHGGGGGVDLPAPINTVSVYGDVFGSIAVTAIGCGLVCILMSPILKYWMHEGVVLDQASTPETDENL
ncbi:MAG: hypothetical protein AAGA30_16470, partial [Planctomycetota bacterium]